MDPSIYQTACESFKNATDTLAETLEQIEAHLAASTKNRRDFSFVKSSLQAKLNQTETKLKVTSDELSIQRSLRSDSSLLMERVTTLQKENLRLNEEIAQYTKTEQTLKQRANQLSNELSSSKADIEAMKQVWKDTIRSYESQIDELRAQIQHSNQQELPL